MAFDSYRGVRISLTSTSDIRYEGILSDVDPTSSSIALTDVKSFGTEGRRLDKNGNADSEIAKQNDKIYPYICFRASNVKDLVVLDQQPPQPHEDDDVVRQDPAIIHCQPLGLDNSSHQTLDSSILLVPGSLPTYRSTKTQENQHQSNRTKSPRRDHSERHNHSQHHNKEQSSHRSFYHRSGRNTNNGRPLGPVIPKGEFNFDESNAKLDKEALIREFSSLNVDDTAGDDNEIDSGNPDALKSSTSCNSATTHEVFYDKNSSFFDTISCDSQDRAQRGGMDYQQRRQRMYQERRTNLETFGVSSSATRFGRGGGRGNRGGGYSHNSEYRGGYSRQREDRQ